MPSLHPFTFLMFFRSCIYLLLCVVRRAAYPKLIQFNARNVHKIRIEQTPRVLQWSRTAILQQESLSHQVIEKTDCSVEESERERVRETTQLKKPAICSSSYQCSEHPDTLSCPASMDLVQWKIGWMKTMQPATALSALDHYIGRPTTPQFNEMTLLHYVCSAVHHAQAIAIGPNPSG